MNFSIYMPSRNRVDLLINCFNSFFNKAKYPNLVEAFVCFDIDDVSSHKFEEWMKNNPQFNISIVKIHRKDHFHRDYYNFINRLSRAKYLWGLNDECEVVNDQWDEKLLSYMEDFLKDKPDRIIYVCMDDSTHINNVNCPDPSRRNANLIPTHGCCFPIISRESYICMGQCLCPNEITALGADVALFNIFKNLQENRILYALDVKVLHHSIHTGTREPDEQGQRMGVCSTKQSLTCEELNWYVSRLNMHINNSKNLK